MSLRYRTRGEAIRKASVVQERHAKTERETAAHSATLSIAQADLARVAEELDGLERRLAKAFAIDVLACPTCGGRLRLLATLHDPAVIRTILAHLGFAHSGQSPGPAPPESSAAAPAAP